MAAAQSAFHGVAVNAITHDPLAGVHVRLISIRDLPIATFETYGATSDRDGRFSIAPIKPGSYILAPVLRGFLYALPREGALPFPSVTIKAGEPLTGFQLQMTPAAYIVGRVTDDYGDPMQNVQVQAEAVATDVVVASPELAERAPSGSTDDRGIFRLTVLPGKYYVKASPASRTGPPEIRTDGSSAVDYAATWFPSAAAKDSAVTIETRPGAEFTGAEIRLGHASRQHSFTISGTVSGIPEDSTIMVAVQFGESQGRITRTWNTGVRRDVGKFLLSNLEPGFYRLYATAYVGGSWSQGQPVEIKLESADIANVELRLSGAGDLSGSVEIADAPRGRVQAKLAVRLQGAGGFGTQTADVDRDGNFRFTGLPAGKYRADILPLPENGYLKSVVVDGATDDCGVIELRGNTGARAKITLGRNAASISGIVRSKDGAVLAGTLAVVFLIDDIDKLEQFGDPGDRLSQVGADGKYSFHNVKPGRYRLVAIDAFHAPDVNKPEILKKVVANVQETEFKEGDRLTRDLIAIGKEDVDAKAK